MKMKKLFALVLVMATLVSLVACGGAANQGASTTPTASSVAPASTPATTVVAGAKEIYFLNFKPESEEIYKKVAAEYEKETGVKVKIVTAASGTYEQTLKSEIAKTDCPTIFQINGPVGYQNWKEYCADLSATKLYSYLTDKSLAVASGNGVYGIPYVVEGYGIIYNNAIMQKYFALTDKKVTISSAADIKDFNTLKAVVEDMTANKAKLGIEGVFASTSLKPGEDWRWQTHLANVPFYNEFKENTTFDNSVLAGLAAKEITFKYSSNFKNIFDLYINNSVTKKGLLGSKSVDNSMSEVALGKAAMVQNGNWAWGQISTVAGNTVKAEDVKFMPIYTGMPDDQNQGLCIGTENFFAINSKAPQDKQDASAAFLEWLFSSDAGKSFVTKDLGFIAPFNTFTDAEKPSDPLAKEVLAWMSKDGIKTVPWTFAAFPSQNFKNAFGAALLEYAQGGKTWDEVVAIVKDQWKVEKAAAK